MPKKALVVIDLQNDYFAGGKWELHNIDAAARNAASVLSSARENGDLVVHVAHEFPSKDAPFFVANTEGAQINTVVAPEPGEAKIIKHRANSFHQTNLKSILNENGVTDVTLVGAMSHMCIDAAARAAVDFGYNVTVVEDACASRDLEFKGGIVPAEQVHAAFMSALAFAYAKVTTTSEYLG